MGLGSNTPSLGGQPGQQGVGVVGSHPCHLTFSPESRNQKTVSRGCSVVSVLGEGVGEAQRACGVCTVSPPSNKWRRGSAVTACSLCKRTELQVSHLC